MGPNFIQKQGPPRPSQTVCFSLAMSAAMRQPSCLLRFQQEQRRWRNLKVDPPVSCFLLVSAIDSIITCYITWIYIYRHLESCIHFGYIYRYLHTYYTYIFSMVADSKDHLTGILEMSEMDHVRFFRLTKLPTCGGVKGPRIWVGSFVWCVWINPGLSSIPNWWSSSLRCGRAKSQVWGVCSIFQLHPITNEGDFWGIAPCRTAKQARRTLPVERKKTA